MRKIFKKIPYEFHKKEVMIPSYYDCMLGKIIEGIVITHIIK